MEIFNTVVNNILSLESYVLIPIIMLILSLIIGIPLKDAIKSAITIGIGFIGISLIFNFFIINLGPAVETLTSNLELDKSAIDVGWTPLALATWDADFAGITLILLLLTNMVMLLTKTTKTMNIDIFNFWHPMFAGALVQLVTGNFILAILSSIIAYVIIIKLCDMITPRFVEFTGIDAITSLTYSFACHVPYAILGSKLLSKIPLIKDIHLDAEGIKKKFGLLGEPLIIGIIIGSLIGFFAKYSVKDIMTLAMQFAAVIYLLPKMASALVEGLTPVSEGMKLFIEKRFPKIGKIFIGVDIAIIIGEPSVLVTGIFLIPIVIILALILPGISFIPLGDLSLLMVLSSAFVVASKRNVFHSLLLSIPILIIHLYIASYMAPYYTALVHNANIDVSGYDGFLTSVNDGGNIIRFVLFKFFEFINGIIG